MSPGVCLCTLIIITNADGALAAEAVGPEAAKVYIGLRHGLMREQEPSTEHWLGKDVKNSVGQDLLVDIHVAGAIGDTPDAVTGISSVYFVIKWWLR